MNNRLAVWIIAGIMCLVIAFMFVVLEIQVWSTRDFPQWMAKVQLVGQQGSTEGYIKRWMGDPDAVMSPQEAKRERSSFTEPMPIPPETARVLFYSYGPSLRFRGSEFAPHFAVFGYRQGTFGCVHRLSCVRSTIYP